MFTPSIRVLLVENSPSEALLLQQQLTQVSLQRREITRVKELDAALSQLSAATFDVVLLDLSISADQINIISCIQSIASHMPIIGLLPDHRDELKLDPQLERIQELVIEKRNDPKAIARAIRFAVQNRQNEDSLRQCEEHFKLACESSHAMVYEFDADTGREIFIHGLPLLLGHDLDEVSQNIEWWFAQIHPDDIPTVLSRVETSRMMGGSYSFRYRVSHKNGKYRIVEDVGRNILDEKGKTVRAIGSVVDITQRMEAEESLRQCEQRYHKFVDELERMVEQRTEELEKRSRQLHLLSSELAHVEERERKRLAQGIHDDLQQLLVGGKFCAETLAGSVKEELRETVRQLNQFLNEAIESTRTLTFELSPPILHNSGLAQSLQYLKQRMQKKYGLNISLYVDEHVEPETADVKVLLFQATRELLFNIVKHAQVQTAKVEMRRFRKNSIQIIVSDSGMGFAAKEYNESDTPRGYGLFSIQGRLELIGGKLDIHSTPGSGCCCTITAPLGKILPGRGPDWKALRDSMNRVKLHGEMLRAERKIRVLIASDQALMRQGLVRLLRGYRDITVIGEVASGQEILEMAKRANPDVIVMDAKMEQLNGIETTCCLKQEFPHVKVIGLSAGENLDQSTAMREAGACALLGRSNRLEALIATIRESTAGVA
jgi:PAS domain S-box-containing protein